MEDPIVRHIVLARFHDQATAADRKRFIDVVNAAISAIPYVSGFGTGSVVEPRTYTRGNTEHWDWGQSFEMPLSKTHFYESEEPAHHAVRDALDIPSIVAQFAILDFVVDFRGPQ
ncbi:MAG: Dabb family protein [Dehalococcoidia bacterium]